MPDSLRLYLHTPAIIFQARANHPGGVTYPITSLSFDTVTLGAYTDLAADQTLLLGTSAGADDLGRVRVQNIATSSAIPLMRTSQGVEDGELTIQDNAYITVLEDYRVWSKVPYIAADGTQYKDTTVPVGDYTTDEPPVANCGPGFAATIDPGTELITVDFDGTNSFAVADGATISTYAWDVKDGTITVGTVSSSTITATFPAGLRWVALTVSDSNGNPHTARCPVYGRDPDDDDTITDFEAVTTITATGQQLQLQIKQNIGRATYPDGTLVLLWEGEPANAADRSHMQFIGWEQSNANDVRAGRLGNVRGVTLECVDVAGRLRTLPGFPQSLTRAATPANWDEMVNPTMDKYIHYLLLWHSTALGLADYTPSGTGSDYPFVTFASEGESLWDQVNNEARGLIPGYLFTCTLQGQLAVTVDPMLQDSGERTATVQATFDEDDTANIQFVYTRPPRTHWLRGHALLTATDYTDVDGVPTLLTVHCIAPGEAPGQGLSEQETSEGLARSQAALNSAKGHEYARLNNRVGLLTVTPPDDDVFLAVQPAHLTWVGLTVSATTAAQRGLTFSAARCLVKEIRRQWSARREAPLRNSTFTLEVESEGVPAVTVIPEGTQYDPYVPGGPPDFGLVTGQEVVAVFDEDGSLPLWTTSDFQTPSGSGGPSWTSHDLGITDTKLFSFVVDPFSPGYLNGTGAINAWVVGETNLWRVTDIFGTPDATIAHTFATAISASSVFQSRTINASFGRFFSADADNPWLLVISHYANASGHTGTWALRSVDGGQTWLGEVQISAHYDTDLSGNEPANIPALYMSPKTPGLAYTAAYLVTANPAQADAYRTTDYGLTWTNLSTVVDSPSEPLPHWGLWDDTSGALLVTAIGADFSYEIEAVSENGEGVVASNEFHILVAPPAEAVRVVISATYVNERIRDDTGAAFSQTYSVNTGPSTGMTEDLDFTPGVINGAIGTQDYTVEFERVTGTSWFGDRDELPTVTDSNDYSHFRMTVTVNTTGTTTGTNTLEHIASITEIELANGHIYTPTPYLAGTIDPGNRLLGDLHVPWENNSEVVKYYGNLIRGATLDYALYRLEADGSTVTDISPVVSTRPYGVNRYGFALRAYDSNRQHVLACGRGNGATADTTNDYVAVFVSSNAGDTWAEIVSAANSTQDYSAAFAGDDSDIIFVWGPADTIAYSSDFGATLDDRSGDLSGTTRLIGIAGGPTP